MVIFNSYVNLPEGISLVGGFKHEFLFSISLGWDVIRNPLTKSIIFQDGHIAPPSRLYLRISGFLYSYRFLSRISSLITLHENIYGQSAPILGSMLWFQLLPPQHVADTKWRSKSG